MAGSSQASISREVVAEPFWSLEVSEAFEILSSSPDGLLEEEATRRRNFFGPNVIRTKTRRPGLRILARQLRNPLIAILIIAGFITIFLREWIESGVIFAAVSINAALGFWQENKAENILERMRSYIRTRARVRRNGKEREIDASDLVPGDIIHVTQGDRIPADARIIFANSLEVDESVLTGESLPEEKNARVLPAATILADRTSVLYGGTLAVQGFGDLLVTATGAHTEFGKIASFLSLGSHEATPLQRAIGNFARVIGIAIFLFALLLFGVGIAAGYDILDMFLISVAVAVSAVPEGLPIALTVILAIGVERLYAHKGIVRRLLAAETLGSTTLILTDKTGTLTEARMELSSLLPYAEAESDSAEGKMFLDDGEARISELLRRALVNTDAVIENPEDPKERWRVIGKPLETALVRGAAKRGILLPQAMSEITIVDRLPFSSQYKFSATVIEEKSSHLTLVFGAPEIILAFTSLNPPEKTAIRKEIEQRANKGERVLGLILKEGWEQLHPHTNLNNFRFAGLLVFRDPLRPGVKEAIRRIAEAGVKTIMVTGDHRGTAEAVARELGMIDGKGAVLTGDDLRYLSEEELEERSQEVRVFARVTPEDKLRLVKLFQKKGAVVAVTGDGVNDAPALQRANIGVALGSGSDVTKDAADLVLLEDNFETIVAAVEEGRRVLDNIRKVIVYLLSDVLDELFLIGGALLAGVALPLSALQILFVNFFSDSFPAIAFAFEQGADRFGTRPRPLPKKLFDPAMKFLIFGIGISTSAFLFLLYYLMLKAGLAPELVRTFIFASFASYTLLLAFSLRSLEQNILSYNPLGNRVLNGGVAIGLLLTLAAIYVPLLQHILGTVSLPLFWLLGVLAVGIFNILAIECGKFVLRRYEL